MSREEKLAATIAEAEKELLQIRVDGEFDNSIELAKLLVEAKQIVEMQLKKQKLHSSLRASCNELIRAVVSLCERMKYDYSSFSLDEL